MIFIFYCTIIFFSSKNGSFFYNFFFFAMSNKRKQQSLISGFLKKTKSVGETEEKTLEVELPEKTLCGETNLSRFPNDSPSQPILKFPAENGRKFSSEIYEKYQWVEYSIKENSVYCFCCRHFSKNTVNKGETFGTRCFIDYGFKKYKDANQLLKQHEVSDRHKSAVQAWIHFKKIQNQDLNSISVELDKERRKEIDDNRHHIKILLEVTSLLGRQGLAFRGHDENVDSTNRGNFIEFLEVFSKYDPILQNKLEKRYGHYCSPEYQNDYIIVYRDYIKKKVAEEIKRAGFFSVIADETKDISKKEQLAVLIRYVDSETFQIKERVIGVHYLQDLSADSLASKIINNLISLGIAPALCVGQCYDGAKVMSGCVKGVQTRFRLQAPCAVYVHCHSHCLNLVLVDTITNIKEADEFFCTIKSLYNYISNSNTRNQMFLKAQQKLGQTALVLERTVETRWFYWFQAIQKVKLRFEAILITLETIEKISRDAEAIGLLKQIKAPSFLFKLIAFEHLLGITFNLSQQLQAQELDFSRVNILIETTWLKLIEARTDDVFSQLEKETAVLSSDIGVEESKTQNCEVKESETESDDLNQGIKINGKKKTNNKETNKKKGTKGEKVKVKTNVQQRTSGRIKKISSVLVDFYVDSSIGQRPCEDLKMFYFEVIDRILAEFDSRFTNNKELTSSLDAFDISSRMFLNYDALKPFIETYSSLLNKDDLRQQLDSARAYFEKIYEGKKKLKKKISVNELLKELSLLSKAYPEVINLFKIHQTLPVTTVESERLFSVLKRVKDYLRNTMGDERLEGLMLMAVEQELVKKADLEALVNNFADLRPRRWPLKY